MSGEDDGALGGVDQAGGGGDLAGVGVAGGRVAGEVDLVGPLEFDHFAGEDVFGDVHQDGAGASGAGDVESFLDGGGEVADVHNQVVVFGDGGG